MRPWFAGPGPRRGVFSARFGGKPSVAGAINEAAALDDEVGLRVLTARLYLHNPILVIGLRGGAGGVEVEREVRLIVALFVEYQVPHLGTALRVAGRILKADFVNDSRFAAVRASTGMICTAGMDADFAGGVPAQHRAVVNQNRRGAASGRRQRGTDAGEPPAYYNDISRNFV